MNMPENFYLAGGWSGRESHAKLARRIEERTSAACVSRWLTRDEDGMTEEGIAFDDYSDVFRAQAVVVAHGPSTRGGKWVEMGLALAWGKPVILLAGPHGSPMPVPPIFAALPGVAIHRSGTVPVEPAGWIGSPGFLVQVSVAYEVHLAAEAKAGTRKPDSPPDPTLDDLQPIKMGP